MLRHGSELERQMRSEKNWKEAAQKRAEIAEAENLALKEESKQQVAEANEEREQFAMKLAEVEAKSRLHVLSLEKQLEVLIGRSNDLSRERRNLLRDLGNLQSKGRLETEVKVELQKQVEYYKQQCVELQKPPSQANKENCPSLGLYRTP